MPGDGDYTLKVSARVNYNGTSQYPNVFVVFMTDAVSTDALLGYTLIPISCVMIFFGTGCSIFCGSVRLVCVA